jgi:hypothetical protein
MVLRGHRAAIVDVDIVGDGAQAISRLDGTVRLWDVVSGSELLVLHGAPRAGPGMDVALTSDRRAVRVAYEEDGSGTFVATWECGACGMVPDVLGYARSLRLPGRAAESGVGVRHVEVG